MASHLRYEGREDAHRNRLAGRVDDVSTDVALCCGEAFLITSSLDRLRFVQYLEASHALP